ncbi:MAG: hypothetical protein AAFP02_03905 [Bacteroidota bacterium]
MKSFTLSCLLLLFSLSAWSQQNLSAFQDYDLFGQEEALEVELRFNYKSFIRNKHKDEYQEALFTVKLDENTSISDTIRMKARGEFRKQYCGFPPIKLNFKKADFQVPALANLEKIKLVTHCRNTETFQQYLYKEYLTYKSLNLITPYSLRVRLVKLTYIDQEERKQPFVRYGFLIEDIDDLAARVEAIEIEQEGVHPELTDRQQMTRVALFEFMIGNTDWHIPSLHNVKLLQEKQFSENPKLFVIPYDFDYSGMVNTMYAIPDEKLNIKSVRDRIYMGYIRTPQELQAEIDLFLAQKEATIALYQDFELLDPRQQNECVRYLEEFYSILENPKRVRFNILDFAKDP